MIDENEKLIIRGLISECICQEMKGVNSHLADIDKKLGNHYEHLTADFNSLKLNFTELNTNYGWLKKGLENKCVNPDGSLKDVIQSEGKQNANIDWLTWGFRLMVGTLLLNALALIFAFSKIAQ